MGNRIKLAYTRAIVDAIHSGQLAHAPTQPDPIFGFEVVTECAHVPSEILIPENSWDDKTKFKETAGKLAKLFQTNFASFADGVRDEVRQAGPQL